LDTTVAILAVLAILLALLLFFSSFPKASAPAPTASSAPSVAARLSPSVVGRRLQEGIDQLLAAGYQSVSYDVAQGSGAGCTIVRQDPPAGTPVARGASASLFYIAGKDCRKGD